MSHQETTQCQCDGCQILRARRQGQAGRCKQKKITTSIKREEGWARHVRTPIFIFKYACACARAYVYVCVCVCVSGKPPNYSTSLGSLSQDWTAKIGHRTQRRLEDPVHRVSREKTPAPRLNLCHLCTCPFVLPARIIPNVALANKHQRREAVV